MSIAIQLLMEAAERAKAFAFSRDSTLHLEVYAYSDHVHVGVCPMPSFADELKFQVAVNASGIYAVRNVKQWGVEYCLKPAKTANPMLDLMNDYQVWQEEQRKASA